MKNTLHILSDSLRGSKSGYRNVLFQNVEFRKSLIRVDS